MVLLMSEYPNTVAHSCLTNFSEGSRLLCCRVNLVVQPLLISKVGISAGVHLRLEPARKCKRWQLSHNRILLLWCRAHYLLLSKERRRIVRLIPYSQPSSFQKIRTLTYLENITVVREEMKHHLLPPTPCICNLPTVSKVQRRTLAIL